ncbi:sugar O-acyltransferase (sialic acid O-acetyltransferase NeuD family) [Natronobacillus azotifigens]|uniref:Acetyltransferase n=1 Tax=Natronobacillus azotifigens TaxID=472978 RepID=A0A9J6RCQ6_9BACI|nr:acetyltransferase [Natronobacillus azotifigens]MCZ0702993.1 acetyltransferase [Natronobacillus azotifigens]
MKDKLLIIGAGGHGKVAADIAIKLNKWESIAFLDDDVATKKCMGLKVIGKVDDYFRYRKEAEFFVAIGDNAMRELLQEKLRTDGSNIISLVHPEAIIGLDVEIGEGTVIMAGAVVNSSSNIGKGCIINTSSSLDHDTILEDYVHISPGVRSAGNVNIGKGTWLGIGSVVSNNVNIYSGCKIGAGAVVIKHINEPGTYVGVPVRRIN